MTKYPPHTVTTGLCVDAIQRALPTGWHARKEDPVRIPDRDSEPEPDVSVVRGELTDYLIRHPGPDDVPLVVEVADSSVEDDREMTVTYGGGGIPVYWLVNIPDRQLEVYTEPSGPSAPIGYRRCTVPHRRPGTARHRGKRRGPDPRRRPPSAPRADSRLTDPPEVEWSDSPNDV